MMLTQRIEPMTRSRFQFGAFDRLPRYALSGYDNTSICRSQPEHYCVFSRLCVDVGSQTVRSDAMLDRYF